MMNLISIFAVALMTLQCSLASAQFDTSLSNNLPPNVVTAPITKKRVLKNFVKIFNALPESVRHEPGTRTELDCMVMGKPAPSVQWLKNGEPVGDFEEEANEILPQNEESIARLISKLIITSASTGDEYTCVATAGMKQTTASTIVYPIRVPEEDEIIALDKLFRFPAKPVITLFYYEMFADIGSDVILPCRIYSSTRAQVFWQDPKSNLIYDNSRMKVLPSGDLLIAGVRWEDMGNYICTAKNIYGKESLTAFFYPVKPKIVTV